MIYFQPRSTDIDSFIHSVVCGLYLLFFYITLCMKDEYNNIKYLLSSYIADVIVNVLHTLIHFMLTRNL